MTVEKLDLSSPDLVQGNVEKIQALFPNVVTEGPDGLSIDFDALRQELSDTIVEGPQERYRLDWPGKRAAMLAANTPISKTLRPVREESVDFDTTQNLFIEGDNLDALKLLQDSYLGKVKMIYIDPPYNTGKDFIYKDNFTQDKGEYLEDSGQVDEDGGRLVANLESNGRYHSDWLSMMYPRLKLARNLLRDDGVIFISIDDNELASLRKICDQIFGVENFIANVAWKHTQQSKNDETYFSRNKNEIVVYRKSADLTKFRLPRTEEDNKNYSNSDNDPNGLWRSGDVRSPNYRENLKYDLKTPSGKVITPPENGWRWAQKTIEAKIATGEVVFNEEETKITRKIYLKNQEGRIPENVWEGVKYGTTREANTEIKKLFEGNVPFDTPKPTKLISLMLELVDDPNALVVDFFSGSSSTADAVMRKNSSDNGKRKHISIQIGQLCDEQSLAYKLEYTSIAEISKERIRRAGAKILKDSPEQVGELDVGFRILKIDSSNMKDVHADPRDLKQGELLDSVSHIKADRSGEDLLFQVMLNQGIELSQSITRETVEGKTVYIVGQDNLIACFDDNIADDVVKNIAGRKPLYAIFRDESFKEPADKINAAQIFKQLTEGHTRMKVI